ncbi:MAG TPA: four helix bundle protein [Bacteroidota bacterium]|nr:four helix bundle protein [Bacteroidota bacterium]
MAKGDDIRENLVAFAVSVMDLCDTLPRTTAGIHIADQLLRSATSAAPNYAEARGAESGRDFIHKLGIVLKELNESEVWIDMLVRRKMAEGQSILHVQEECKSLCRIIAASVRTAKQNMGRTAAGSGQKAGDRTSD